MQEDVNEGKEPCPEHKNPKIQLSDRGVELDGRAIAGRDTIAVEGSARKIGPLFTELKNGRELWKQLHPGIPFEPVASLEIPADTPFAAGASMMVTTAYAGYPVQHVVSGGISFDVGYETPRPIDSGPPVVLLTVERVAGGRYDVAIRRDSVIVVSSQTPLAFDAVLDWVRSYSGESLTCPSVIALTVPGEFVVTATLIRRLLDLPTLAKKPPTISFRAEK